MKTLTIKHYLHHTQCMHTAWHKSLLTAGQVHALMQRKYSAVQKFKTTINKLTYMEIIYYVL